jgi:hypothetical protein
MDTKTELNQLAPPHKPQQKPEDYLKGVFRTAALFRVKPYMGRVLVYHLTDSPFLSPVFSERICVALEALAKQKVAIAFESFIARLVALIMVETGQMALKDPATAATYLKQELAGLDKNEHPTLCEFTESLCDGYAKRAAPNHSNNVADTAVAALLADLSVTIS